MHIEDFRSVDGLSHKDFEHFVKDLLEASGWQDAVVTEVGSDYRHGDGGVDIFAYRGGRKFAVEVKQRQLGITVDVSALNQLVTGAKLAGVKQMILVTNSYFTSEVKVRALRLGVELIDRDELKNLFVVHGSEIGRKIKPREYQVQVIQQALEHVDAGKRKLLIEMATGLGKTYTVALLIKQLLERGPRGQRVLFIAHQIEILLQSVTAFKNVLGVGNYSFSACFAGVRPEDTDLVFASFDTLYSQLGTLSVNRFDYVIVDEAHHTPARTYAGVVTHFQPRLLIGLTATPWRTDNKSVSDFFGGPDGHIGRYDLIWALQNKKLAFPKYMVMLDDIDQERIDQLESGLSVSDLDKRLFLHKKDQEVVRLIEATIKKKQLGSVKGIVFCRNIRHLQHLLGFFEAGTATSVHSRMPEALRRENIRNFREGELSYILVCDLFNEGIDIPETNLLVFMRYTGSKTVWLQQLGRGLRKTANKDCVHVLDFVGSLDRLKDVQQLVKAVQNKRQGPVEGDLDEAHEEQQSLHDDTIEVTYSQSAARVLELIERLSYRLNSRETLVEQLRRYYEVTGRVPLIEALESSLDDLSVDQVATHFDSYQGFLLAAFGWHAETAPITDAVAEAYAADLAKHGLPPSPKALALQFVHKSLPWLTVSEMARIIAQLQATLSLDGVADSEQDAPILDSAEMATPKPTEPPKLASANAQENAQHALLAHYRGVVNNRTDLLTLSRTQLDEITRLFRSTSVFLMRLRSSEHA
ncbi:restriction endonuclease [Pseudomonas fluorescens HK44]|uniref:Restriction endonuclease n=1 Tax=Pseudomonas fluorescens HK44 TaxID=1042209 RepID=A0A010SCV3_PSEFL|nr:DEAD/DEAH box helicase family protein [Pseudomonas fluorescens]EXF91105.1 restriction endonuclease [Pseudomonas fluorescens HK44]